ESSHDSLVLAGPSATRRTHHLLIEFGESGVVTRARAVRDKDLFPQLVSWWRLSGKPLDFSSPVELQANRQGPLPIRLTEKWVEFSENQTSFRISRDQIIDVSFDPPNTQTLRVKEKTVWGRQITFKLSESSFLLFLKYVAQSR